MKFKDIPGFPGYKISKDGRVFSDYTREDMKLGINNGYYKLKLRVKGVYKNRFVHRLAARTYLPNPHDYPKVNHKDGNKLNNCIENLEWITSSDNVLHAYDNGLLIHHTTPVLQFSLKSKGKELGRFKNMKEAFISTGDSISQISRCCNGENTRGNFYWEFESPETYVRSNPVPVIQYELVSSFIREFDSIKEASEALNISSQGISRLCKGKRRSIGGYIFKYKNPVEEILEDVISWEEVSEYPGYRVSDDGRIYSEKSKIMMKTRKNANGYCVVDLTKSSKSSPRFVHRLVALTYIPNDDKTKNLVNHLNGDPTDNRVENLEWSDRSGNGNHAYKIGLNKGVEVIQYDKEGKEIGKYKTISQAMRQTGLTRGSITESITGTQKFVKGYRFVCCECSSLKQRRTIPVIQYNKDGKEIKRFPSVKKAALELGTSMTAIRQNIHGNGYHVKGLYKFKFSEDSYLA